MTVKSRRWEDNAFWHNPEKDMAEAILILQDESNREITQVLTVRKLNEEGDENLDFLELINSVGIDKIDQNTEERKIRKEKEKEEHSIREESEKNARELERLFDSKIKMLALEDISSTKNKVLKSKLRRSKNIVELNMYAQLIIMEKNGIGFVTYDTEQKD